MNQEPTDSSETHRSVASWILAGTLAILPLVFKPGIIGISNGPKFFVAASGIGLCLLAIAATTWFSSERSFLRFPTERLGLLLFGAATSLLGYSLLSGLWATNPYTFRSSWAEWGVAFIAFALVGTIGSSPRLLHRILAGLVIGAALNAGLALFQFVFDAIPNFHRAPPSGSFLNKNFAASYSVIALGPSIALYFNTQERGRRILWFISSLLLCLFIFHAFSRASWAAAALSAVAASGFLWILARHSTANALQRPSIPAIAAFIGLFLLGTNLGQGGFEARLLDVAPRLGNAVQFEQPEEEKTNTTTEKEITGEPPRENSFATRLKYWTNIRAMAVDAFPLGVGQGNFQVEFPPYANQIHKTKFNTRDISLDYAHNEYLEVAAELGIPGIIGMLVIGGSACGILAGNLRSRPYDASTLLLVGAFFGFLGLAVNTLASSPLNWPGHKLAFAVCLGVVLAAGTRRARRVELKPFWFAFTTAVAGIAIVVASFVHYDRRAEAEKLYQQSGARFTKGIDPDGAVSMLLQAAQTLPFDERIVTSAGAILKDRNRYEEALRHMERLAELYPHDFRNNQNLAHVYLRQNRKEKAREVFERMHRVIPSDIDTSMKLAVLLREKDWQRSDRLLDEALEQENALPLTYILRAENAMLQNNESLAARTLVDGGKQFPGNSQIEQAFYSFGFEMYSLESK